MIKALMIESKSVSRFHTIESTPLGAHDVRVKVRHVGLCGSDLNTFKGLNPLVTLPRVPGHEIGGEVVELGSAVSADLCVGTAVIVMPYTSCGECSSCRKGRVNACRYNKTLGVQQDGGLAEEIVLPEGKLIRNDSLPARRLALVEPLSVGFHAVKRGRVERSDRVVVIGCGMIGMGVVIAAVKQGAQVVVIEPSKEKREKAEAFGAAKTIDPTSEDVAVFIDTWSNGDGADVVLEAVGLPQTFTQAIDLVCYGGRVVYVGYSKAPVTYDSKYFNLKELDILGSRNATLADFEEVVGHLEIVGDKADALISKVFSFDEAESALPFWSAQPDALKVIVER